MILQQGDLDGLCGYYSIVNAFTALVYGTATTRAGVSKTIFRQGLFKTLLSNTPSINTVVDGVDYQVLLSLIKLAIQFTKKNIDITIVNEPEESPKRIDGLISRMRETITAGGLIIVGLGKKYDHWTVVTRITEKQIHFGDSGGLKELNISNITCGVSTSDPHRIDHAFMLRVHNNL